MDNFKTNNTSNTLIVDGQCKSEKTWCIEDGGWSSYEVRWWPRNAWAAVSAGQRAHRLGTVTASGGSASIVLSKIVIILFRIL
jgi:hypothetical protein